MKVLLLLGIVVAVVFGQKDFIRVDNDTRLFADDLGRIRQFHGVNAVFKIFPWIPITEYFDSNNSIAAEDIENLKEWGMNVVRLGVMWPGVEPERGQFNQTYLDAISTLIKSLGNAGIYTIVDFHQDVMSRKFCGEGIPDWAVSFHKDNVKPFPEPIHQAYPLDSEGYPSLETCLEIEFGEYYFTDSVASLSQALYNNSNGLQDDFVNYWKEMVRNFKDLETVLGYELINEPFYGDIFANETYLFPGRADLFNLQPMYERLNQEIRQIDNDHIIFFERCATDALFPAGFTQGPGSAEYNDRQVLSYHVYCLPVNSEGDPTYAMECDLGDTMLFDAMIKDTKKLNVGGMLTEFGAMTNSTKGIQNIHFLTGIAESKFQSWAYWQFKFFADLTTQGTGESFYSADGEFQVNKVKALSRTYAKAIAGIPTFTSFTPENSHFQLRFIPNPDINEAPTEIYFNEKLWYPNGMEWYVTPLNAFSVNSIEHNTLLLLNNPQLPKGTEVSVFVVPTK